MDSADPDGDSDKFGAGKLNVGNLFYDGTGGGGGGDCFDDPLALKC